MIEETPERRRVARLTIPRQRSIQSGLKLRSVRLLELSAEGARIEHLDPLHEGLVCFLDLPPALGRVQLTGRVVWTRFHEPPQTLEWNTPGFYQSGLAFVDITPEQREELADAIQILKMNE